MAAQANRTYVIQRFGKPPEVALEIVSNKGGDELSVKPLIYARMGFRFYAVYDPLHKIQTEPLQVFRLADGREHPYPHRQLEGIGLGLTLWEGTFEDLTATYLRWCDADGRLVPTGEEQARRLRARLRALGADPDQD